MRRIRRELRSGVSQKVLGSKAKVTNYVYKLVPNWPDMSPYRVARRWAFSERTNLRDQVRLRKNWLVRRLLKGQRQT